MRTKFLAGMAGGLALFGLAGAAQAQVFVRAPFVRVAVGGGGVRVRAPFVNLNIPSGPRYYGPSPGYYAPSYYAPSYYGPRVIVPGPGAPRYVPAPYIDPGFLPPAPRVIDRPSEPPLPMPKADEPLPAKGLEGAVAVDDFVKSFKPRGGSYEIDLINPVTKAPTNVRFTLPEGSPKSVVYRGSTIEFNYGPLRFVRIEFDKDGAVVTSR